MAFSPRNIGTHHPHEPVVLPPAPPSLIVPPNHEAIFWPVEPAPLPNDESVPVQPVETGAQRRKRERTARKARVARWIDNASPRYVPGAMTSGKGLFAEFRRTTPCTHEDEAVSMPEFMATLRVALGRNLATQGRPGYVEVIADDAAIAERVRHEKHVLRAVADDAMTAADPFIEAAPARRRARL